MDRRTFVQTGLAASATAAATFAAGAQATRAASPAAGATSGAAPGDAAPQGAPAASAGATKRRLRQSVCAWCFGNMPLDELCELAKSCGIQAIDLLSQEQWGVPAKHGLACSLANGPGGITVGWNRPDKHDELVKRSEELIPAAADAGVRQMIVFSGNRAGMPDDVGLRNCAQGLRRIMPLAQKHGIVVVMELLNSKVDHKDYMCDRSPWGVELCKQVGSDHFRLLYDIYHMQIMEGDVIRTIRELHPYFAHYHTAGNPGRSNLDDTQELNYRGICEAIVATGFDGYLAQEFMPRGDPAAALRAAAAICDAG
ncbi:MAG: TIM barrel protein [Phycisphaerales bacterium]